MKNDLTLFTLLTQQVRRYWIGSLLALLLALFWMRGSLLYAAPLHQTVPPPTPTQEPAPVPTATSVPDNNDDDDNNNEQPAPTWTPTTPAQPQPQPQPTVGSGLTGVVTVQRLNVRQGPGTNFGVIGTVAAGESVTVLSRNEVGDWWHICCTTGTTQDGWVAVQFIQPNFDLGQASTLIPLDEAIPPPAEPTATPTIVPGFVPTTTTVGPVLQLQLQQAPPYAWQGQILTLIYQIDNRSDIAATTVELRNELPLELTVVGAPTLAVGTVMTETTDIGRTVIVVRWPEVQAGASVTAAVQVQVAESIADGAVIDNLAVVAADGAQSVTSGISIGMPPTILPDFR